MAELLDDSAIEDALVSLSGWQRQDKTLVKDVQVDEDGADRLEVNVAEAADELDHHPVVNRTAGGVRFTVWTHSAGGVTSKDVELAARIDEAVAGTGTSPSA